MHNYLKNFSQEFRLKTSQEFRLKTIDKTRNYFL